MYVEIGIGGEGQVRVHVVAVFLVMVVGVSAVF